MKKQDINNFVDSLSALSSYCLPTCISLFGIRKALYIMKKQVFENSIKGLDKKELFCYLVENRVFIDSLSNEELKKFYKYFKTCYKNRIIDKIKNFFRFLFKGKKEVF